MGGYRGLPRPRLGRRIRFRARGPYAPPDDRQGRDLPCTLFVEEDKKRPFGRFLLQVAGLGFRLRPTSAASGRSRTFLGRFRPQIGRHPLGCLLSSGSGARIPSSSHERSEWEKRTFLGRFRPQIGRHPLGCLLSSGSGAGIPSSSHERSEWEKRDLPREVPPTNRKTPAWVSSLFR
jgi:hypothetical protein